MRGLNYDQRISVISASAFEFLRTCTPPKGLGAHSQNEAMAGIIDALNRNIGPMSNDGQLRERMRAIINRVRDDQMTHAWPPQGAFVKAARATASSDVTEGEEPPEIYEMVVGWWRRFGTALPSTAKPAHADRMVSESIATYGQLRRGGFPLSERAAEAARGEPDPRHDEILGGIRATRALMEKRQKPVVETYDGGPSLQSPKADNWKQAGETA